MARVSSGVNCLSPVPSLLTANVAERSSAAFCQVK
jgi:hypothetical protein